MSSDFPPDRFEKASRANSCRSFAIRTRSIKAALALRFSWRAPAERQKTPPPFVRVVPSSATSPNPARDSGNPSLWRFRLLVDFSRAELTASRERANFALIALSRFGHSSAPRVLEFDALTSVRAPAFGWSGRVRFQAGARNAWSGSIFDVAAEGQVSAEFDLACGQLPGAVCSCARPPGSAVAAPVQCSILWSVPADFSAGAQEIQIYAVNRSPVPGDALEARASAVVGIDIDPAPPAPKPPALAPVPPPGPAPAPAPAPAPKPPAPAPPPPAPKPPKPPKQGGQPQRIGAEPDRSTSSGGAPL